MRFLSNEDIAIATICQLIASNKLVLVCKKMYASELQESGFLYQDTIDENYPQRDFHTMYVGKIEKVLVRDDEYLKSE